MIETNIILFDTQPKILAQAWSPATSGTGANKVAFIVQTPTQHKIYLVSTNGGTATPIYTVNQTGNRLRTGTLTWSPDGTNLAFTQWSGTDTPDADKVFALKIIDLSGNVVTTLQDNSIHDILQLQWSSANNLVFAMSASTSIGAGDYYLYTMTATAGSTPTQISSTYGGNPYWSPNNSEIVCGLNSGSNGAGTYRINVSTLSTTFVQSGWIMGDWK